MALQTAPHPCYTSSADATTENGTARVTPRVQVEDEYSRDPINAHPFPLVAVEDVPVDGIALLLVQFRRVDAREVIQHDLYRGVHVGTRPQFLPPVQNQLGLLQRLQQLTGDLLDFLL